MKTVVNVHDLKTNYSKYLERVMKGEEIILGKHGKPVAKFVPVTMPKKRKPGILADKKYRLPDTFDDPIPELSASMERTSTTK